MSTQAWQKVLYSLSCLAGHSHVDFRKDKLGPEN